jgi:hypothetical protein
VNSAQNLNSIDRKVRDICPRHHDHKNAWSLSWTLLSLFRTLYFSSHQKNSTILLHLILAQLMTTITSRSPSKSPFTLAKASPFFQLFIAHLHNNYHLVIFYISFHRTAFLPSAFHTKEIKVAPGCLCPLRRLSIELARCCSVPASPISGRSCPRST